MERTYGGLLPAVEGHSLGTRYKVQGNPIEMNKDIDPFASEVVIKENASILVLADVGFKMAMSLIMRRALAIPNLPRVSFLSIRADLERLLLCTCLRHK